MANHKPDVTVWPTRGQIRASTETLARALGMKPYHFATLVVSAMQEKGLAAGKDDEFSAMFGSDTEPPKASRPPRPRRRLGSGRS